MTTLDAPIYVAGHRGMVGSALVRALKQRGHTNLVLALPPSWISAIKRRCLRFWKR